MDQGWDRYGWWSYMKFSALDSKTITIITAYKLCTVTSAIGTTTYQQQLALNNHTPMVKGSYWEAI
eukprot:463219-Ditylum_brightwellii.AAC.1